MADIVSPTERSRIMSLIRSKNTRPEHVVRKLCTKLGTRYRLHRKDLPGSPDLVFVSRKTAIFVNGCFWHHHRGCRLAYMPKTRVEFWSAKFEGNRTRDLAASRALRKAGWRVAVVWECETHNPQALLRTLSRLLK